MFEINEDKTINITRGDIGAFTVDVLNEAGEKYLFQKGDVVRIKVTEKKACENVMFQKDFVVTEETEQVEILLTEEETKIGEVISKPTDYWYEIELNPFTNPQTIIGYDEDGAKIFKLYPEGKDVEPIEPTPEDIPVVDEELDLTSERPVQNQAITRAMLNLQAEVERIDNDTNITSEDLEPLVVGIEENKGNIAKNTGSIEDLSDNVENLSNTLDTHTADKNNPHNVTAEQTSYDNSISGVSANKMQGAIDELKGTIGYTSSNLLTYPYVTFTGSDNAVFVTGNVYTRYGVSYTDIGDGTLVANGVSTEKAPCYLRSRTTENFGLKKGKYILSGCTQGGSESTYYIEFGKTGSDGNFELIGYDYGDGLEFELEEDTNNIAVTIVIQSGQTIHNLVFKPMIRYASIEDDTYEPYVPSVCGDFGYWTPKGTVSNAQRNYYIKTKNTLKVWFSVGITSEVNSTNRQFNVCDNLLATFGISSHLQAWNMIFYYHSTSKMGSCCILCNNNKLYLDYDGVNVIPSGTGVYGFIEIAINQ